MNEETTPAVVEATPSSPPSGDTSPDDHRGRSGSVLSLVIALLALILAIGLAVGAYFIWHQVQQLAGNQAQVDASINERIQPLRASLDSVNQSLAKERQTTTTRVDKLDEDLQGVSHRISVVASLLGRSERGWALAEIEYLLRIANQRLQLQGDVKTAQQAIKAADGRLRDLADPHYFSVREQLARDLEAVNAVPVVDLDGLSLALSTALAGVDQLPLAGVHYRPVQPGPESSAPTARNLDDLGRLVWTSLTDLFRLREHDRPVAPMLAPDREYFLRENMRLQLAAARLALLRGDRQQYRSTLDTALGWLQQYFDKTDLSVQQLVGQLTDLALVDISPAMPDVSQSLALLRQQMQLSEQPQVLPVVPEHDPQDDSEATSSEPGVVQ